MNQSADTLQIHVGFREQNFGDLIGQRHEDITGHLKFVDGKIFAPNPPGGESIISLIDRVSTAIQDVKQKSTDQDIVIFCHGGTIRAAHVVLNNINERGYINHDTAPLSLHSYAI